MRFLKDEDPDIAEAISLEKQRQQNHIDLIAAENYVSNAVLEATGSLLTNKYSEGYAGARYYGGCQFIDRIEQIAVERAKKLFGAEHANVQPHSGSQANMAAYLAILHPGDTVLAMSLAHGGHLTHGSRVNFSGQFYNFVSYGVDRETELLNYDEIEKLALAHKPKLIVAGASAYPRLIDFKRFRQIADRVNARLLVDMAHLAGLVAAGAYPSPVPYAQVVTSSSHKTMRGPRGGFILSNGQLGAAIDKSVFPGVQGGPLMHVIAAKAVCFLEAMRPEFVVYQKAVLQNARVLAQQLEEAGLRLVSGGTDNHLLLVDLTTSGITGKVAERALDAVGITVNRNAIPFDPLPPQTTSGIRLGTPAVTSRGFGVNEINQVGRLILRVLASPEDPKVAQEVRQEVADLAGRFPVPGAAR